MADMHIEHKYTVTREQAYEKVSTLLTSLQEQYKDKISNPTAFWNETRDKMKFSFGVYGFILSGEVQLNERGLVLDGKLSWLIPQKYKDKAEDLIRKKLEEIL